MKFKLGKTYLFSNDGVNFTIGMLTRVDNHIYPYCANYQRYSFCKEKREKMSFKIGDWVRDISPEKTGSHQIKTEEQCIQATENCSYEPWQPKEGEWCIMKETSTTLSFTVQKWTNTSNWTPEPFIGTIPSFIGRR